MRRAPLAPMSAKRRAALAANGIAHPSSTLVTRKVTTAKRPTDTGPKQSVRDLVRKRSGGMCEWPGCPERATDVHHRLNRKDGGRFGEMRDRLNGVAWLIHACRTHHAYVTSPHGFRRQRAKEMGWLLLECQDAAREPVLTRHDREPVFFTPAGGWVRFEEACA